MYIHESLKNLRELRGLDQTRLAQMAGISQATISKVESGKRLPSIQVLMAILEALDAELVLQLKEDIDGNSARLDGADPYRPA